MRTLIFSIIFCATLGLNAQTGVQTTTFTVKGNCEECKERIENAADVKGVKLCKWNPATKVATVTYDPAKTDIVNIQKSIAAVGYDAGDVKGNDKAYNKLPKCCQYKHGVCEDPKK
jgi:mercuric ion binding protein